MKKLLLFCLAAFIVFSNSYCVSALDINTYNLKEHNVYMLDLNYKADTISISDKDMLNITPVTSLTNDGRQLLIEAFKNGVCDVLISSDNKNYLYRFITGSSFQDNKEELIELDVPPFNK